MSIRKIDKNIGTVPAWGDEDFDERVHENFVSLKEIMPRLDNSIDDINGVLDSISSISSQMANDKITLNQAKLDAIAAKDAAVAAKNLAEAVYDNFDDRYLDTHATAPTVDNDGNALRMGALYFNSTNSKMYVYDATGAKWVDMMYIPTLLSSLSDILFSSKANNDVLQYDSATGKWVNRSFYSKAELDAFIDIHTKLEKTTLADADEIAVASSSDGFILKKIRWESIKTLLSSIFIKKIVSPVTNALSKINADGTLSNTNIYSDASGNVGVGQPNPVEKLDVNGGIRTACASNQAVNTRGLTWAIDGVTHGRLAVDNSSNLLYTGFGALGYGTGSGGTVTQLTSKSTTVTLNKPTGAIIMNNAALAAGASISFIVNNNIVSATGSIVDNVIVSICSGISGYSNYRVQSTAINGGFVVTLTNQTGISLSEALSLKFDVIRGAKA